MRIELIFVLCTLVCCCGISCKAPTQTDTVFLNDQPVVSVVANKIILMEGDTLQLHIRAADITLSNGCVSFMGTDSIIINNSNSLVDTILYHIYSAKGIFDVTVSFSDGNKSTTVHLPIEVYTDTTIVIFKDSFEENGAGSIFGWNYYDDLYSRDVSFSSDVPPNSGSYSLALKYDTIAHGRPYPYDFFIYRTQSTPILDSAEYYIFSFWINGVHASVFIHMDIYSKSEVYRIGWSADASGQWTHIIDTMSRFFPQGTFMNNIDSVTISLGVNPYTTDRVFLDNIEIKEIARTIN